MSRALLGIHIAVTPDNGLLTVDLTHCRGVLGVALPKSLFLLLSIVRVAARIGDELFVFNLVDSRTDRIEKVAVI